jgi:hypothetical protein
VSSAVFFFIPFFITFAAKSHKMQEFEGYVGVRLWDGQMVNDLIFALLLALLLVFALVFHSNFRLFVRMVRDVFFIKDSLSLFEDVGGSETVFRSFMIFQSLFLTSLILFLSSRIYGYIGDFDLSANLAVIGLIFVILFVFYLLKQIFYSMLGAIFATDEQYSAWRIGYTAATGFWGVLLYLPVLWLAFIETQAYIPIIIFVFSYVFWRLIIIYKTICIFNIKGIAFLYIILYLCAQGILPLIFLYEGIIYLYNFIDEIAIWR